MEKKEITKEEALTLYHSEWWVGKTVREIAGFQLFQDRLCTPWDIFHEAVEQSLGRGVFTHEFGSHNIEELRKEFCGEATAPTLEEVINLLPQQKRIILTH